MNPDRHLALLLLLGLVALAVALVVVRGPGWLLPLGLGLGVLVRAGSRQAMLHGAVMVGCLLPRAGWGGWLAQHA